jgi:signal transduction histidine kinase
VPRDESVSFGLPRRMSIGGLSRIVDAQGRTWGIVVLTTAERVRDRERHELWRLAITIGLVTVLTALFGIFMQRRQRAEQERERELLLSRADKMASLAAIGTGIAHELGTPLSVIVGRAESALSRSTDERVSKSLTVVLEQSARIEAIVKGCLALVRGEAPPLSPRPASVIAGDAVALVSHRFEQSGVRLESRALPDLPSIACEPALFAQVLVNLLLNACHATPRGGLVTLDVRAIDGKVHFVVEDEGEGIDAQVAARATEPFFSTRREEGGHGLGLSIAREIVSHHQGTLTLERRERGHGTRATVSVSTA